MITEVHQEGRFYRLSTGRAAHYENIKPHNPSTKDWCIPADMEEGDYLMMDPACEVKSNQIKSNLKNIMENINLDELMDLAEAYVGPMIDALINILGHDNRGDRPTEVLLMAAYGERGVLDRPNMRVMRWRNGALSGSDLANEPGLGSSRTYQPG